MEEGNSESHEQENQVAESHESESNVAVAEHEQTHTEKTVPISAVQKERKKRQELQQELEALRSQAQRKEPEEEDLSKYETVTREELGQSKFEISRGIREEAWAESFPDRAEYVNSELEDFIKQRPNLALAIQGSPNRLKEAWELMNALKPKKDPQRSNLKKDVPVSPGTVPKSAALNEAVDVMSMSDSEFREWRKTKAKRR